MPPDSTRSICRCRRADADDFVTFARAFGVKGASVTIPHKVALFERIDEVDAIARRIGAINTIRVADGRWVGRNTDAGGFLQPLQAACRRSTGCASSMLGAGGAARAVAVALAVKRLLSAACTRAIAHVRPQAAALVVRRRSARGRRRPDSWDLLVNCTPVGMYPRVDETPVPASALTGRYVYDLVYNPPVDAAAARGSGGGLPDDRRPRHAGGAGAGAVPVVDRRHAAAGRDARRGAEAVGGVHTR